MDKNIEQLLLTAGKMIEDTGRGDDWQSVVKASGVSAPVANRLVSQGLLRAHVEVGVGDAKTGLEAWHLTATAKEMVVEMVAADADQPKRFGGKGWGKKGKR